MYISRLLLITLLLLISTYSLQADIKKVQNKKQLVYIVSDMNIPFWQIMSRGIKSSANTLGYEVEIYSSNNSLKTELESTIKAIRNNVSGIIVSPTSSSSCVNVLKFAKDAGIPVVISDVGTDGGEYVSFISSDNKDGAYKIGQVLAKKMKSLNYMDGTVGIVAIPQKRLNGQLRTAGFMQAMKEAGIRGAGIEQQVDFSEKETYRLSTKLINQNQNLRALWLQGSDKYHGAIKAIVDSNRQDEILLLTFDAEPEFLDLIPDGVLVGSAMQQPYLMGKEAVVAMDKHLKNEKVTKNIQLPILAISSENIKNKLPLINKNVLGIETSESKVINEN